MRGPQYSSLIVRGYSQSTGTRTLKKYPVPAKRYLLALTTMHRNTGSRYTSYDS